MSVRALTLKSPNTQYAAFDICQDHFIFALSFFPSDTGNPDLILHMKQAQFNWM